MCEPTTGACARLDHAGYCDRCDLLVGLEGLHVTGVGRDDAGGLRVTVETPQRKMGCPACGSIVHSHGRHEVALVDTPCFGRPATLVWRKRSGRCAEAGCATNTFTEVDLDVARSRALLTTRACWWAIGQIRREHASVEGLARQLGTAWMTVWSSIEPLLAAMAADESRFEGVARLGVDEHVWHHVNPLPPALGGRGPKELTGMVDLTPDADGRPRARLLDLVPGRSGKAYGDWLTARSETFRRGVQVATLDPFHGYKNAIDAHLDDAVAVLDAFHVVKLGTMMLDEVRRRVQQETLGHRGRRGDPLYGIRTILRAGAERLTDRQHARLAAAIAADPAHEEVHVAWQVAQRLRAAYVAENLAAGRRIAEQLLAQLTSCPIPEVARLGRTLRQWSKAFLAYFATGRANNGGTEAVNGLIELHRRIARGFRSRHNYRLRMPLIGGGLTHPNLK
ncbi:MAG: ISL3 family transposase [Acidimicrobiales bacterium]